MCDGMSVPSSMAGVSGRRHKRVCVRPSSVRPGTLGLYSQGQTARGRVFMPAKGVVVETLEAVKAMVEAYHPVHNLSDRVIQFSVQDGLVQKTKWYVLLGCAGFCAAPATGYAANARLVPAPGAGLGPHLFALQATEHIAAGADITIRKGSACVEATGTMPARGQQRGPRRPRGSATTKAKPGPAKKKPRA